MNEYILITFITADTPYEDIFIDYLLKSFNKLHSYPLPKKLELDVFYVENEHNWNKNVAKKPQIIEMALEKHKSKDIVFLDADATIEQYPTLFDTIPIEYDLACHFLDWGSWYGHSQGTEELLSGTLYLRNNDKIKQIVKEWKEEASKTLEWEQKILERIVKQHSELKVYKLPLDYCYIKTLPNGKEPRIKIEHPVIIHHQISRITKRILR